MTQVVHHKKYPYDVLIDRTTPYGNPFSHKENTTAIFKTKNKQESLDKFRIYCEENRELFLPLKDKILGCWCDSNCHGHIIAEIIDRNDEFLDHFT